MNLGELDRELFLTINPERPVPFLDAFFAWVTDPPGLPVLLLVLWLLLFLFNGRRGRVGAVALLLAVGLADYVSSGLIKPWIDRVRPCVALPEARLVLEAQARSPSFPSSHAANTFAAAAVLWGIGRGWRLAGLVVAAVVSLSRVYVGVHYPGDVLLGGALGFLIGWSVRGGADWLAGLPKPGRRGGKPPADSSKGG